MSFSISVVAVVPRIIAHPTDKNRRAERCSRWAVASGDESRAAAGPRAATTTRVGCSEHPSVRRTRHAAASSAQLRCGGMPGPVGTAADRGVAQRHRRPLLGPGARDRLDGRPDPADRLLPRARRVQHRPGGRRRRAPSDGGRPGSRRQPAQPRRIRRRPAGPARRRRPARRPAGDADAQRRPRSPPDCSPSWPASIAGRASGRWPGRCPMCWAARTAAGLSVGNHAPKSPKTGCPRPGEVAA